MKTSNGVAIRIENLYKEYKLGVIGYRTLRKDFQSSWAKLRGKEDPNSLISVHHNQEAEKGSFLALNDVSYDVNKGDRVGIIGKNGAGKSTLLKIISRITAPTRGSIKIRGRIGSLLEIGTGFHPELTGRENIFLNGAILGMTRKEISLKLDAIVSFSGVDQHIDTPVKRYSSGMSVRLGFSVAIHLEPEILIVDEVLAIGDVDFQKKAIGKMNSVSRNDGRTILFVSHKMSAIKKLCNKGVLLNKGEIVSEGNVDDVIHNYLTEYSKKSERIDNMKRSPRATHLMKFTSFKVVVDDVVNPPTISSNASILFQFTIFAVEPSDAEVTLQITNADRTVVYFDLYKIQKTKFNFVAGENFVRLHLSPTHLSNDIYHINITIRDGLELLDCINNCYAFSVVDSVVPDGTSIFSVDHQWEISTLQ